MLQREYRLQHQTRADLNPDTDIPNCELGKIHDSRTWTQFLYMQNLTHRAILQFKEYIYLFIYLCM